MKVLPLVLLFLSLPLLAQSPAPSSKPASKTYEATDQAKAKLLGVIVHQQQLQMQMAQLETQYKNLVEEGKALQAENVNAQEAVVKSSGADPAKYQVNVSQGGEV